LAVAITQPERKKKKKNLATPLNLSAPRRTDTDSTPGGVRPVRAFKFADAKMSL